MVWGYHIRKSHANNMFTIIFTGKELFQFPACSIKYVLVIVSENMIYYYACINNVQALEVCEKYERGEETVYLLGTYKDWIS